MLANMVNIVGGCCYKANAVGERYYEVNTVGGYYYEVNAVLANQKELFLMRNKLGLSCAKLRAQLSSQLKKRFWSKKTFGQKKLLLKKKFCQKKCLFKEIAL